MYDEYTKKVRISKEMEKEKRPVTATSGARRKIK